ncbi:unnamed protein product [Bemisia tabaci]|uniref:Uncharacterized protein n=1 Tax=Bemisia tabaci TaxID=7038 RepID=A0A9P0AB50_BEMTA|nr:unnamed protein product [Bemisia tabaci]
MPRKSYRVATSKTNTRRPTNFGSLLGQTERIRWSSGRNPRDKDESSANKSPFECASAGCPPAAPRRSVPRRLKQLFHTRGIAQYHTKLKALQHIRNGRHPSKEGLAVVDGESGAAGAERRVVSRETNPIRFVRLVVQRLIYGIATMIGLQDAAEEVADGALVPPGVDDYGFGLDTVDTGIAADNKDYEDDDDYKDDDEGYDDYIY